MSSADHTMPRSLRRWRLRALALWCVSVPMLTIAIIWAAVVPDQEVIEHASLQPSEFDVHADGDSGGEAAVAFAANAFDVTIWTPPPPEPVREQAPPPTPVVRIAAPKIELIGIMTEIADGTSSLVAAVYDPDQGRVRFLRDGDQVGPHAVESIDQLGLSLAAANGVTRLELSPLLSEPSGQPTQGGGR